MPGVGAGGAAGPGRAHRALAPCLLCAVGRDDRTRHERGRRASSRSRPTGAPHMNEHIGPGLGRGRARGVGTRTRGDARTTSATSPSNRDSGPPPPPPSRESVRRRSPGRSFAHSRMQVIRANRARPAEGGMRARCRPLVRPAAVSDT